MLKIDNLKLFEYSLNNPEPIIDEFYLKSGDLIISKNPQKPTNLMLQNVDLLESISAYSFARKTKSSATARKALKKILKIIKNKNINYSEFVSFWSVVDISYSIFCKMSGREQLKILKNITEKYIDLRHGLYSTYGYTPTTLQASKDAKAHKESGNLGIYKVSKMLDSKGFKKANNALIKKFISGEKKYIESDKKGKKLFKDLLKYYNIDFKWSSKKENKMPDFLIRHKDDIYIIEHKHMKEGGGGQDKQINEIISFIGYSENNKKIHYISFLDGIYFNLFANKTLNKGKILNQIINIENNLKNNKQNYFVNTAGFKELLKNL
ncbi:hypothetical protein COV49_04230 [Candidatus Falkowbacteria bacterium CG11_big_fil_rev_8_21_14_0_20_39_10]|uniref:Restriction endonuclease n=1 Tax=Candidatus Falkowbacteria bacterium CG11_big_fil_rev_8_21_14_0_20_39_10 TaxID=1974570 RepID=A0A2M6K825_9BACT|nr:MAG: hypothetical protein COV49_04230 [Candidatus Falkowbacteria bacterium CG11_big_fil_rev_8_21_14_0_20_39_10]